MPMNVPQTLHRQLGGMLLRSVVGAPRASLATTAIGRAALKPAEVVERPHMFSWTMLKKYWEIGPILVIVSATMICQALWIMRTAVTRDDVRYSSKGAMLCEARELDREAPPVRKFRVYNQKYVVSPELYEALEALKPPTDK